MPSFHHILDSKKQQIDSNLETLFDEVRDAIDGAIRCLFKHDMAVCKAIVEHDASLNERRRMIEQDCLVAIASQQPVANDLRFIVADMRIAGELERMGDYASDIAASAMELDDVDVNPLGLVDIQSMAALCQQMLSHVKRAHREGDAELANRVAQMDGELDARLSKLVNVLMDAMRATPANVHNGSRMLWMAHNLERCGDRATNIAEQVVFRVRGDVVDLD
jgi:phosphate transport system protein